MKPYHYIRACCLLALVALHPLPAEAFYIRNVDDTPHQLKLHHLNKVETITLAPNEGYRSRNPSLRIKLGDQKAIRIRPEDEYVIKRGRIVLMRRNNRGERS